MEDTFAFLGLGARRSRRHTPTLGSRALEPCGRMMQNKIRNDARSRRGAYQGELTIRHLSLGLGPDPERLDASALMTLYAIDLFPGAAALFKKGAITEDPVQAETRVVPCRRLAIAFGLCVGQKQGVPIRGHGAGHRPAAAWLGELPLGGRGDRRPGGVRRVLCRRLSWLLPCLEHRQPFAGRQHATERTGSLPMGARRSANASTRAISSGRSRTLT